MNREKLGSSRIKQLINYLMKKHTCIIFEYVFTIIYVSISIPGSHNWQRNKTNNRSMLKLCPKVLKEKGSVITIARKTTIWIHIPV